MLPSTEDRRFDSRMGNLIGYTGDAKDNVERVAELAGNLLFDANQPKTKAAGSPELLEEIEQLAGDVLPSLQLLFNLVKQLDVAEQAARGTGPINVDLSNMTHDDFVGWANRIHAEQLARIEQSTANAQRRGGSAA